MDLSTPEKEYDFVTKLGQSLISKGSDIKECQRAVRDNINPWMGKYLEGNSKRSVKELLSAETCLINDTARRSMAICGAGISQGTMPKSQPWIRFELDDQDLNKWWSVKVWLEDCQKRFLNFLSRTNGYQESKRGNDEHIYFGTEATIIENDWSNGARFIGHTAGEYHLGYGINGKVEFLHRWVEMNAYALRKMFKEDELPLNVNEAYNKGNYFEEFQLNHIIFPNGAFVPDSKEFSEQIGGPKGAKYRQAYYFDADFKKRLIGKSTFNSKPFYTTSPWGKIPGIPYGHCPGFWLVGHARQVQAMEEEKLRIIQKTARPPVNAPAAMQGKGGADIGASGVNYIDRADMQGGGVKPVFELNFNINSVSDSITKVEDHIARGSFNDLFLSITNTDHDMTKFETLKRWEEKIVMVGPVLESMHEDKLVPMSERVWEIMTLRRLFLDPPKELPPGTPIKVTFISPLAEAQKLIGAANIEQFTSYVGATAPFIGKVTSVNFSQGIRDMAIATGVSAKMVYSEEEEQAIIAGNQQRENQQMLMANAKNLAESAQVASETQVGGKSVLDKVAEASNA